MTKYDLAAVVVPHKSIHEKHFISYVKRDDIWYWFNDEFYAMGSQKEALAQTKACMLFYKQWSWTTDDKTLKLR